MQNRKLWQNQTGLNHFKQAAKLLNKHAPDGESLAYINPEEAKTIKSSHGGSGIMTLAGVPTYGILDWITDTALPWVGEKVGDLVPGTLFRSTSCLYR